MENPGTVQTAPGPFDELSDLEEDLRGGERFLDFIPRISPNHEPPEHIRPIAALVERVLAKGNVRALISMPPRHAKTTTLLHGLAWILSRSPADTCAYVTYADALSQSKSRIARRLAQRAGVVLASDSKSLSEWRTTDGGGLLTTGIGGPLTGQGVTSLLVVDDPTKNREEAESVSYRERNWEWFNDVAYTRLEPGASCIVVATRWHQDDLIGRLSDAGGWEILNLPAFNEVTGEALWPERFPASALEDICRQVGEYTFASLYQGQPRSRGAHVFERANRFDLAELDAQGKPTFTLSGKRLIIAVDPAASESTHADHSVALVMASEGYGTKMRSWILDVVRMQVIVPTFVQRLRDMQLRWRAPLAVESVGGFKAIPQMLRQIAGQAQIMEIRPLGDKFTRAQPVAAAWNDGRVLVPIGVPWADAFLSEVEAFTGIKDVHDDQVDALAHAWNTLAQAPLPRPRERVNDFAPF